MSNTKTVRLINPILAINGASMANKQMTAGATIQPFKPKTPAKRKQNGSTGGSFKFGEILVGGAIAGGTGLGLEILGGYLPIENRILKAVAKGAIGGIAGFAMSYWKAVSNYAGYVALGGVASAFGELGKMVKDGKVKRALMPVRIPKHQVPAAVAQGAIPAKVLAQASNSGNAMATNALNDAGWYDEDDDDDSMNDLVYFPVKMDTQTSLQDLLVMR